MTSALRSDRALTVMAPMPSVRVAPSISAATSDLPTTMLAPTPTPTPLPPPPPPTASAPAQALTSRVSWASTVTSEFGAAP